MIEGQCTGKKHSVLPSHHANIKYVKSFELGEVYPLLWNTFFDPEVKGNTMFALNTVQLLRPVLVAH